MITSELDDNYVWDCEPLSDEIEKLLSCASFSPYSDVEAMLCESALLSDSLPDAMRRELYNFRVHGNDEGVLLLRSLPTESRRSEDDVASCQFFSERLLGMIASRFGDIFSYIQEWDGALFQTISPRCDKENKQSSEGSIVPLELHTEKHFHPYTPDYVLLSCVQSDPNAETVCIGVRRLREYLSEECENLLFQEIFRGGIDYSFGNLSTEKGKGPRLSVFYGNREDPFLCCDLDLMVGDTAQAQKALAEVRGIVEKTKIAIVFREGDLLIIDNRRAMHGRGSFRPRYNQGDRRLQRVYVTIDLRRSAADRKCGSRVITTRFEI